MAIDSGSAGIDAPGLKENCGSAAGPCDLSDGGTVAVSEGGQCTSTIDNGRLRGIPLYVEGAAACAGKTNDGLGRRGSLPDEALWSSISDTARFLSSE